jgi:hypothetical protein
MVSDGSTVYSSLAGVGAANAAASRLADSSMDFMLSRFG